MNRSSQASLSITISQSFLKLLSIESAMPSSHLVLVQVALSAALKGLCALITAGPWEVGGGTMGSQPSFAAAPPCSFPKWRSHILPFKWNRQTWVSVHCDSLQPPSRRGKYCPL